MVRFIMSDSRAENGKHNAIYIPIWLDLLSIINSHLKWISFYLHSNMVRFIISILEKGQPGSWKFTFQYG